jgi:hypothetical protein
VHPDQVDHRLEEFQQRFWLADAAADDDTVVVFAPSVPPRCDAQPFRPVGRGTDRGSVDRHFRCRGFIDLLRRRHDWSVMTRRGLEQPTEASLPEPKARA